jgi:predicted transcriptional regulator
MEEKKMSRDFKVGIISELDFNAEVMAKLEKIEAGETLATPAERIYFGDMKTFLQNITPKRFALMDTLHKSGSMTVYALAKRLKRHYANVHADIKALEIIGLVEKNSEGSYAVPWDEVTASFKLAA